MWLSRQNYWTSCWKLKVMRLSDLNPKENDQIVFWCRKGETLEKDISLNGNDLKYLSDFEIFEPEDNSYKDQKRIDVIVNIDD